MYIVHMCIKVTINIVTQSLNCGKTVVFRRVLVRLPRPFERKRECMSLVLRPTNKDNPAHT